MAADRTQDQVVEMPEADRDRIAALLRNVGGPSVVWGAGQFLEIWMVEHRMRAEREASARLTRATWALTGVTLVLAGATVALVVATLHLA